MLILHSALQLNPLSGYLRALNFYDLTVLMLAHNYLID